MHKLLTKYSLKLRTGSIYTQWISRCIAAARERIPGSIENDVTGVSECSQQRSNLKDDGYILFCLVLSVPCYFYLIMQAIYFY
ncbi:hypothetical protein [Photorhabdus laumondii]|uniref:hypothetical protein n=1 Tax=Photorhabdus laumondii TaxID=2218628 RepID=UPI0033149B3D